MEYTKEQIKRAEVAVDKLPPVNTLAQKYLKSDEYKYDLYCYKEHNAWRFRSQAENMVREILGDELDELAKTAYWQSRHMETEVGHKYRRYIAEVSDAIDQVFLKECDDYRLADYFGKKIDVIGTGGARRLLNCPIKNAYVIKFDGYYQLSILEGAGEKAGDYKYVSTADSYKEIALGLPYLMNLNVERCERELTEMKERGQLPDNKAVYNKWFLTDEVFNSILDKIKDVEVQTYALIKRGYSSWNCFQVKSDRELDGLSDVWKVIGRGMTYAVANEMQKRVDRVSNTRSAIDTSADQLERAQARLERAQQDVEDNTLEYVKQCRNLDNFLHNNSIPDDVIVELNKSLTRNPQENAQPTTA